jgi:hypothetical protein
MMAARIHAAAALGRFVVPKAYQRHKFSALSLPEVKRTAGELVRALGPRVDVGVYPAAGLRNGYCVIAR